MSPPLARLVLTTMDGAVILARSCRGLEAHETAVTTVRDDVARVIAAWTAGEMREALVRRRNAVLEIEE